MENSFAGCSSYIALCGPILEAAYLSPEAVVPQIYLLACDKTLLSPISSTSPPHHKQSPFLLPTYFLRSLPTILAAPWGSYIITNQGIFYILCFLSFGLIPLTLFPLPQGPPTYIPFHRSHIIFLDNLVRKVANISTFFSLDEISVDYCKQPGISFSTFCQIIT